MHIERTIRLYLSGFFLDVVKPLKPIVELPEHEHADQIGFIIEG